MLDVQRKLGFHGIKEFLERLIIFMTVLVLQLVVWYHVIVWACFVCLYCCIGSALSVFRLPTYVRYSQRRM